MPEDPLEETSDVLAYARNERTHHGLAYVLSLLGLFAAAALGLSGSAFLGYTLGMLFAILAMVSGLRYWPHRFVNQRWLPHASRLEVEALPHTYRRTTAPAVRVDGHPRVARSVMVSTSQRRTEQRAGRHLVLLVCDDGLVKVDGFASVKAATQLGRSLGEAMAVPVTRCAAGPPERVAPLSRFALLVAPLLLYAPALLVLRDKLSWTPLLVVALHMLAAFAFELRLRSDPGAEEEAAFRKAAEETEHERIRVRADPAAEPPVEDVQADTEQAEESASEVPGSARGV
ncbi:MAG: hypothetical protein AB8I08_29725 [Sandaracinaceae bacterium]